jgi:hypothetical protein
MGNSADVSRFTPRYEVFENLHCIKTPGMAFMGITPEHLKEFMGVMHRSCDLRTKISEGYAYDGIIHDCVTSYTFSPQVRLRIVFLLSYSNRKGYPCPHNSH